MSNYTQNTFFTPKDSLESGNPLKIIRGSDIDGEFSEISSAIASKEDTANKGAAGGYAPLDGSTKLSTTYLPTVPINRGGTGVVSITAGSLVVGAGTDPVTEVALGANRDFVVSDGATWEARAIEAADVPSLDAAKITTGEFSADRIPELTVAKLPVVDVEHGGTGRATLTAGSYLVGNGTGAVTLKDATTVINEIGAARTLTAGVGLSGGGTLDADRSIAMGTPSDITGVSTNSASGTTHSHAVGAGVLKAHAATGERVYVSTLSPTGGVNGDIWLVVE